MSSFRIRLTVLILALMVVSLVVPSIAVAANRNTDGVATGPRVDQGYAIVQLKGDPLSTYVKTKPAPGKKIDFNNSTSKSYRAQLSALRNNFKTWLRAN